MNLAGPKSRQVLASLTGLDLSAAAFPYLAVREGEVAGIPARLMRVGFVGEWGYEIHVPASMGGALWDALMTAGKAHAIRPFGVEAQRLLRLEKGHIIIGQDQVACTAGSEIQHRRRTEPTQTNHQYRGVEQSLLARDIDFRQ